MHSIVQQKLIKAGVRNLREFGYPDCDSKNILTDMIYSAFFKTMLDDSPIHRKDVEGLLAEIAENTDSE